MSKIIVYGGGTFSHVRSHLALAAPAFGKIARAISSRLLWQGEHKAVMRLTKMADPNSDLVTNEDIKNNIALHLADPDVRGIVMSAALCDYDGVIGSVPSGPHAARLKTVEGGQTIVLTPADKLLKMIRAERKDIFLTAFKTTCGATDQQMYEAGLHLLKRNSCNLVWANDVKTRRNMLIVPEEAAYAISEDRDDVLIECVDIMTRRMNNTFTRSTVVESPLVPWEITPTNLKKVVDHCVSAGAYKPVLGKTAGHFAYKLNDEQLVTSRRKSNFNASLEMVMIESAGRDKVLAYGAKPSVGGQSQRIIFKNHEEDCIVHFHSPMRPDAKINKAVQYPYECGSHQCGQNTSDNLAVYHVGGGHYVKAVMLDNHGPNILFNREVPAEKVINFIEQNFDLTQKSGGFNVQG